MSMVLECTLMSFLDWWLKIWIKKNVGYIWEYQQAIRDFEYSTFERSQENRSLKYHLELKDDEIGNLKRELSTKDKIINKLQAEKEKIKQELKKFKNF